MQNITIIEEKKEDVQLTEEQLAEYNSLVKENPKVKFTKEDYLVYKTITCNTFIFIDKKYTINHVLPPIQYQKE